MKARLLVGLLTVALGGLTSCSNILEENGVINNVAESGMGELRINLVADGTLNAMTKTTEDLSGTYENLKKDFHVTLTAPLGVTVSSELPNDKPFSSISGIIYTLPAANGYTLKANYGSMGESDFGWNCPVFEGTESINVAAGAKTDASVTCELKNAIINVDLSQLDEKVTVTSLYAYSGDNDNTKFYLKGAGVENDKVLGTDIVYVKSGVSAKLILTGKFKQEGSSEPISFTTPPQEITASGSSATTEKTKYNVTYTLNTTDGQMTIINININGIVTAVPITVPVDPYNPAN